MGGPSTSPWTTNNNSTTAENVKGSNSIKLVAFPFSDTLLPSDFVLTKEEQSLLDTYASIRLYEKEAAKFREAQAKAKLTAADERYKRQLEKGKKENQPQEENDRRSEELKQPPRNKSKKRKDHSLSTQRIEEVENVADTGEETSEDEDTFITMSEPKILAQQNNQKYSMETAAATEEAMRGELLGEAAWTDLAPLIKKKPKKEGPDLTMLLSSVEPVSTPPHDFSKSLGMTKEGADGFVLFPPSPSSVADSSQRMVTSWSPPTNASEPSDRCLEISLPNFDKSKLSKSNVGRTNNTLAIKFSAPSESKRFSFNITAPTHNDYTDVLAHFNPRSLEKGGQLLLNDKQASSWGNPITLPLSEMPKMFGQIAVTLIVQISSDGFDFFVEGKHCMRLAHRTELPTGTSLNLQFPSTDDFGNSENWRVYRVWWGHKESMVAGEGSVVAGAALWDTVHRKKLFIQGLAKIYSEQEATLRRAGLERAFHKYGGKEGAIVIVPLNVSFAFVELESERQAELALLEQSSNYKLSYARKTKFEALQEQRGAGKNIEQEWE